MSAFFGISKPPLAGRTSQAKGLADEFKEAASSIALGRLKNAIGNTCATCEHTRSYTISSYSIAVMRFNEHPRLPARDACQHEMNDQCLHDVHSPLMPTSTARKTCFHNAIQRDCFNLVIRPQSQEHEGATLTVVEHIRGLVMSNLKMTSKL